MIFAEHKKLQRALAKKPIDGCMLSIEKVPKRRNLQVSNIGNISEDSLSAYFGNTRKSGGSGDPTVELYKDQDCAIVTFEKPESKRSYSFFPFLTLHVRKLTT